MPYHTPRTLPSLHLLAVLLCGLAILGAGCENARPFREAGDRALQREDFAAAATNYEQFLAINPGDAGIMLSLGRSYLGLGRPHDAARVLAVAAGMRPRDNATQDAYATALLRSGRHDELIRNLRTRATEQGDVSDWIRLGRFAGETGDADLSRQALITAARIDRGRTTAPQLALHDFFASIGDTENAYARLRMAFAIDPRDDGVISRMERGGFRATPRFALPPLEREEPVTPLTGAN